MTDNDPIRSAVREAISRQRACGYPDDTVAAAAMQAHIKALEAQGWSLTPPNAGSVTWLVDHRMRRGRGELVELPHGGEIA